MTKKKRSGNGLDSVVANVNKKFGDGSLIFLGGEGQQVESVSSGNIALDLALGVGGYPLGRVIEIFGPESSGKTTLALHAVAETQKSGGNAVFVDAEHALDPVYAANIGVNVDSLLLSQPKSAEEALSIVEQVVASNEISVVVVDSVAALTPEAEIRGDMGDSHVGLQARLMSQALRKLGSQVYDSNCLLIFVNQIRDKIGVMFGPKEMTPGGRALKFFSSVRLDVRRSLTLKDGEDVVGGRTKIRVVKNKVAPPFKQVEVDIIYGKGMSNEGSVLDIAVENGLVVKSGSWFSVAETGERMGQGRNAAIQFLCDNPVVVESFRDTILGGEA